MSESPRWYRDADLVAALPFRYRAYAAYSRVFGASSERRVRGGSFMLRALRASSRLTRSPTVAPVRGLDGLIVLADFADERVLEVIHEIRGENPEYRVLQELLSDGDTFVDIGANFGTFSLLASRIVGPSGRVVAIEPQPRLAKMIAGSVQLSHAGNIQVMNVALGSGQSGGTLLVPDDDSGRAGLFARFSGVRRHAEVEVEVTALDDVLDPRDFSRNLVIKIDVEGSEMAVIAGARRLLASRHPPLIIELNPWSAAAAGFDLEALVTEIGDLGYRRFSYAGTYPRTVPIKRIALDRQTNLIATT